MILFGMSMNTKMSGQPSIKYQYILKYYKIYLGEMSVYSSYLNVKQKIFIILEFHTKWDYNYLLTNLSPGEVSSLFSSSWAYKKGTQYLDLVYVL